MPLHRTAQHLFLLHALLGLLWFTVGWQTHRYLMESSLRAVETTAPQPPTKTFTVTPATLRACTASLLGYDATESAPCICQHEERVWWEPCPPRKAMP